MCHSREHHTKSRNIRQISGDLGQISGYTSHGGCGIYHGIYLAYIKSIAGRPGLLIVVTLEYY